MISLWGAGWVLSLIAVWCVSWALAYHVGTARGRYLADKRRRLRPVVALRALPPGVGAADVTVVDAEVHPHLRSGGGCEPR